ncbi:probable pre-mRNA-splicing factor ATP-dependent RNA helicase DEAH9 [Telopea speciosissima]|uniref:probable pre-mRNA-splicing factor ATP-dependent RNA helicase DEAH9 n=1 Tax=Telopea speciosissima TaxID=54955 RepID=UPI001CC522AC|nr:probable pre-mRNA-splicing factor ATP-dependent RNA helicase DEAH9 [Telopea speciosissima]
MAQFWKPGSDRPRLIDDEEGGVLFYATSSSTSSGFGYSSIEKQRQRLPVFKYRTAILYLVETHATTIIVGETGSGKTTQIPQFLKEAGWAEGGRVIACTQPRRLAVQVSFSLLISCSPHMFKLLLCSYGYYQNLSCPWNT